MKGPRILVVDDEPNITELVAMALRYEGFEVQTAANGRDALRAVGSFRPEVIDPGCDASRHGWLRGRPPPIGAIGSGARSSS